MSASVNICLTTLAEFFPVDYPAINSQQKGKRLPCNVHAATNAKSCNDSAKATKLDVMTTLCIYLHLAIAMLAIIKLVHPFSLSIGSG